MAEQVCGQPHLLHAPGVNTSGEAETQFHKVTEQSIWLGKVTPPMGSFFDLIGFWLVWILGTHGFWGHMFDSENCPAYSYNCMPGALHSLKSFKCLFTATNHPANLPEAGLQKRNKANDPVKKKLCAWRCDLWIPHRLSKKAKKQHQQMLWELQSSKVRGSRVFSSDHISQLRVWSKGENC